MSTFCFCLSEMKTLVSGGREFELRWGRQSPGNGSTSVAVEWCFAVGDSERLSGRTDVQQPLRQWRAFRQG